MVVPGSDLECCDQLYVLNQNQMANKIADVIDGFMQDFGSNDKEDIEPEPKKNGPRNLKHIHSYIYWFSHYIPFR